MRHRTLCLTFVLSCAGWTGVSAAAPLVPSFAQEDKKAEFEKKLQEAEGNVTKLWKLHEWCQAYALDKDARTVLRKILKLDDTDRKAHELLGEIEYDGKWFPSQKKLDEYKQKKLEDEAKKAGKVLYKGEIVEPADLPFLEKGMKKLEDGRWVTAEEHKRISEGWLRQDLEWISPEEAPNMDKGLWKCGDKWLSEADANAYHANLNQPWRIPNARFWLYSTCTRDMAIKAMDECDRAYTQLNRVLGRLPKGVVPVLVLNGSAQYNEFAGTQGVELRGFSSLHGATIGEIWEPPLREGLTSAGYCYFDLSNDKDKAFSPMYVRHAAAQSILEALDPSPKMLAAIVARKPNLDAADWWKEKQLPEWFRYGVCVYIERYIVDQFVNPGGDAYWMRKWSIENITNKGGIDSLDQIFAASFSLDDVGKSQKLMNQLGLLIAFAVDGKCDPVTKEHQAFKEAFKNGKDVKPSLKALETAIRKNESALRVFAGI